LLSFTVEQYDAVNTKWINSTLYSVTGKTITIPNTFSINTYTRIHITSDGGIDAYVNVLLSIADDILPELTLQYPTKTTKTNIQDGKNYEFRDKDNFSADGTEEIKLTVHDNTNQLNVKRVGLSTETTTILRLYYSVIVTRMSSMEEVTEIGVSGYVDDQQSFVLVDNVKGQLKGLHIMHLGRALVDLYGDEIAFPNNSVDPGLLSVEEDGALSPFETFEKGIGQLQLEAKNVSQMLPGFVGTNCMLQSRHKIPSFWKIYN